MKVMEKLLGDDVLNDARIHEVCQRHGGDVAASVDELVDTGVEYLDENTSRFTQREVAQLVAQLLNPPPSHGSAQGGPAGWLATRLKRLEDREEELREIARELVATENMDQQVQEAKDEYEYYLITKQADLARDAKGSLIKLRVEQGLLPHASQLITQVAGIIEELKGVAANDLGRLRELKVMVENRLQEAKPASDASSLIPECDWLSDPASLAQLVIGMIRRQVIRPIGELAQQDLENVLDMMLTEVIRWVESAPGLEQLLSPQLVRGYLNDLPIWRGVDRESRLLWEIENPVVTVQAPPSLALPPNSPPGCSVTSQAGDPHSLVVRSYLFLPLPAANNWSKWLAADADIFSSAEPWAAAEQQSLLDQYESLNTVWCGTEEVLDPPDLQSGLPNTFPVNGTSGKSQGGSNIGGGNGHRNGRSARNRKRRRGGVPAPLPSLVVNSGSASGSPKSQRK